MLLPTVEILYWRVINRDTNPVVGWERRRMASVDEGQEETTAARPSPVWCVRTPVSFNVIG